MEQWLFNIAYEVLSDKDKREEYDAEVHNDDYLTAYATEPNNQNNYYNNQNTDYRNNYYSSYQKSNNNNNNGNNSNNSNIPFIVSILILLSSDIIGSVLYKMNFIDNKLMVGIGLFFVGTLLISLLMKIQDGPESDSE